MTLSNRTLSTTPDKKAGPWGTIRTTATKVGEAYKVQELLLWVIYSSFDASQSAAASSCSSQGDDIIMRWSSQWSKHCNIFTWHQFANGEYRNSNRRGEGAKANYVEESGAHRTHRPLAFPEATRAIILGCELVTA